MKRMCVLLLVALTAGGIAPVALAADTSPDTAPTPPSLPAPASTQRVLPPALQALEQKMAQIRFNSASFSTRLNLAVNDSTSSGAASADVASAHNVVIATSGVLGLSPLLLSSVSTTEGLTPSEALGGISLREERIGASVYIYDPSVARHDGGRPWVHSTRSRSEEKLAAKLAPLSDALNPLLAGLERPTAASTGLFAPLLEELAEAQSIQETGPATVDGQQTLAFTLTLSSTKLLERVLSTKEQRRLGKGRRLPDEHFTLEIWIAPSGLPVQTVTTDHTPGEEFGSQEDILGLEVPVAVLPPPAAKTISQARLIKIERRRAKAIGLCIRHHRGRPQTCVAG